MAFISMIMVFLYLSLFFVFVGGGAVTLVLGIIFLNKGKSAGKTLTIVGSVCLGICLIAVIMTVFLTFYSEMSLVEDGMADFSVPMIEENGYQEERFTVDGTTYVALPIEPYNDEVGEAVYCYVAEDPERDADGNYYRFENSGGFDLVSDGCGMLFCPEEQAETVLSYYKDPARHDWFITIYETGEFVPVSDALVEQVNAFCKEARWKLGEKVTGDEYTTWSFVQLSDGEIHLEYGEDLYLLDGRLYYPTNTFFEDEWETAFNGVPLPEELSDSLLALMEE